MTTAGVVLAEPRASAVPARSSALIELVATGGGTLLLFPLLWALRAVTGFDDAELAVGFLAFHAAHVINDPHFSVTYLLFYKDVRARAIGPAFARAQRARYLVAGFLVPAALVGWAAWALASRSGALLGAMMELMFVLVGWHYVKQGFGVLSVLSARRGVRYSALERRVVLAHAYAGWAFAWASPGSPARLVEEKGVVYRALAHPAWLELASGGVFAASTLALVLVLANKWRRESRLPLTPLTGFLVSVWVWTVFSSIDPLMLYVIPALHSIQYLYFVWLLRRNHARSEEGPPLFGKPAAVRLASLAAAALALGWLLFHGAPEFFDTAFARSTEITSALGPTPYFAAIFAIVNIHHYFMDHVIWRRDHPDTRHLLDA